LNERKMYLQLYEAMEALVHICRDGCRTIGPHDKALKEDQDPCNYSSCKQIELLVRHFASCKMRVQGGCIHCNRMWQLLELHSHLCADSDRCRVPLCRYHFNPILCAKIKMPLEFIELNLYQFQLSNSSALTFSFCLNLSTLLFHYRNFKQRRSTKQKKEDIKWRILVRKILTTKIIISGAPCFSMESS